MNPMIHGDELHRVPGRDQNPLKQDMLVRSSSAQHQLMEPAPGAESQSPGSLQLLVNWVIRPAPAASLTESKKEKEASP